MGLTEELGGLDVEDLYWFLRPGSGVCERYALEEAGPLDDDGVPWWFPHRDPESGDALGSAGRREWLDKLLSCLIDWPTPAPVGRSDADAMQRRHLSIVAALLRIKADQYDGCLPRPDEV